MGTREELIGGPYQAPWCRFGPAMECLSHGTVRVAGMTDAPIPWPYAYAPGGKRHLVLCGDLVRAICVESVAAVSHHWGVSRATVTRWRRLLGVSRMNLGTRQLWRRLWPIRLGMEGARRGGRATKGRVRRRSDPG